MDNSNEKKEQSDPKPLSRESTRKSKIKKKNDTSEGFTKRNIFGVFKKSSFRDSSKTSTPVLSRRPIEKNVEPPIGQTQSDAGLLSEARIPDELKETTATWIIEPHAEEYFMKHTKRGRAIILNQENFEKEDPRIGTKIDVERLQEVLPQLKFDVEVYTDLDYFGVIELLRKLSKEDYSDHDCIAFFVLTHGNKKREISAKDVYYSVDKLWEYFTGDNCPTLAGKPKLFFINACRGEKKDRGIRFFRGRTEADSGGRQTYKIPKHADFLIAYSTVDGFLSYRERENGTWFIQCFCEVLIEHYKSKDLMKMLTITARKVAIDFRTQGDAAEDHDLTQVPSITTMLIRDVYFHTEQ